MDRVLIEYGIDVNALDHCWTSTARSLAGWVFGSSPDSPDFLLECVADARASDQGG